MQRYGRPNLKPSLTWGFIRVFALHKNHYRTTCPCRVETSTDTLSSLGASIGAVNVEAGERAAGMASVTTVWALAELPNDFLGNSGRFIDRAK